jgi:hypothetical protein
MRSEKRNLGKVLDSAIKRTAHLLDNFFAQIWELVGRSRVSRPRIREGVHPGSIGCIGDVARGDRAGCRQYKLSTDGH